MLIRCVVIQALTCCVTEREEQWRRGRERRAPEFVRSRWCALFFLHQSDKWHNEATPLNVREPSVALPVGLCRRQKGETREEGGHVLEMFALKREIADTNFYSAHIDTIDNKKV